MKKKLLSVAMGAMLAGGFSHRKEDDFLGDLDCVVEIFDEHRALAWSSAWRFDVTRAEGLAHLRKWAEREQPPATMMFLPSRVYEATSDWFGYCFAPEFNVHHTDLGVHIWPLKSTPSATSTTP